MTNASVNSEVSFSIGIRIIGAGAAAWPDEHTTRFGGAFLALHAEDVVIVNIAGRRVFSREELAMAMKAALDSPLPT